MGIKGFNYSMQKLLQRNITAIKSHLLLSIYRPCHWVRYTYFLSLTLSISTSLSWITGEVSYYTAGSGTVCVLLVMTVSAIIKNIKKKSESWIYVNSLSRHICNIFHWHNILTLSSYFSYCLHSQSSFQFLDYSDILTKVKHLFAYVKYWLKKNKKSYMPTFIKRL